MSWLKQHLALTTIWLVLVNGTLLLLWNESMFFASAGIPIAKVATAVNEVSYRSEDDSTWRRIGKSRQSIFDGDRLATGKNGSAVIDFGDGRAARVSEDSSLAINTIRQRSGLTYVISLPKGAVAIQKTKVASAQLSKNQYPIIIRSDGRDYMIEPEEERGISKTDKGVVEFKGPKRPKVLKPVVQLVEVAMPEKVLTPSPNLPQLAVTMPPVVSIPDPVPPPPVVEEPAPKPVPVPPKPAIIVEQPKPVIPVKKDPTIDGTEVALNTSKLSDQYFTLASLNAIKGDIGVITWTKPGSVPPGWEPAVQLTNGSVKKDIGLGSADQMMLKIEDFGALKEQSADEGVPCASIGIRGGAKLTIEGKAKWSFKGAVKDLRVCSYRDAVKNVPLVVSLSSIGGAGPDKPTLFPGAKTPVNNLQIMVTGKEQYLTMLSLMEKSESVRVEKLQQLSPSGTFIAKGGKVISQVSGSSMNAESVDAIMTKLSGEFAFKGSRSSLYDASGLSTEGFKKLVADSIESGRKIFIHRSGSLFPVSPDFIKEREEVAGFVKSVSTQIFTEKVEIISYK